MHCMNSLHTPRDRHGSMGSRLRGNDGFHAGGADMASMPPSIKSFSAT